ncbi:Lysine-specific demethylase lid-like protein [Emericellopsis cladophorae]|uniref:Lysine-specific demethylase lid-like protein n=1 Tax=Emericellopsis cladophorae TaxID=2686198 RepID=A0A9P9Y7T2_9HYPO|nr:Lysine-specific demethylase lid-like protein [Emericellopsis cladophorae]KAI6784870.1 Lysine-specific demethylase lid-like protein [Emericellopsis cladophorae]
MGGMTRSKDKISANGYHPTNPQKPLSALVSPPLDLTSVERRGQPNAAREPLKPKNRPFGIREAPSYTPTEEEWRDPLTYMKKIAPEASKYGICKVIPPDSWNPDFAIDTERFHFRTRKQELNSVEGSTRANLTYLDGLSKYHKQHGNANLHRLPYVDKKPLDLYKLKKAVESRGGFENVCKLKKWAEIGRDLGYSGKIMSSLSTSLKNSYQKWLCPYEDYLRLAKPGVHQQLEAEYGGPLTPTSAVTPAQRSLADTPMRMAVDSPARQATDALQAGLNGLKKEESQDTPMSDAPPAPVLGAPSSGFTAVNSGFTSVNRPSTAEQHAATPEKQNGSPMPAGKATTGVASSGLDSPATLLKRQLGTGGGAPDVATAAGEDENDGSDSCNRRSKRLKKDVAPTVAGSYMSQFRPSVPKVPRDDDAGHIDEKCGNCGRSDDTSQLLLCDSCDGAYHSQCLDPPLKRKPDAEWNCARCLVGDGQFGFEEGGLYSLRQFQQKANDFKQGYFENKMPFDHALNCHRPVTEEDVETEFWRLVTDLEETTEVEYGADIHCTTHGSGFPTLEKHPTNPHSADTWNLNVLPFHPESLFRHIKTDISGMTVPWVYVGMIFSTFCWHNEDHYAYSANYQHFGATKTWYGIPGEDAEKFETAMRNTVPELFETQPDLLFQLVTLLTPEQLKKADVNVYAIDQRAGQFVITFPQAYHAGFNHGFNFNEAVNFAPSDWEPYGLAGVERLQNFRRQPCFSHDELLWTAAEGTASSGLTIQTAKWLAPALDRVVQREITQRGDFIKKHSEAAAHKCSHFSDSTESAEKCPLPLTVSDDDVQDEEEQCCAQCKAFAFFSRFKCAQTGKVLCILHAGWTQCCEQSEIERFTGDGHSLIYRKTDTTLREASERVAEKARVPDVWEQKYNTLLDDEARPSLKSLRTLLNEGERIAYDIDAIPTLKEFVDRCNDWVEEATTYLVRKQQNRRKSEKVSQGSRRKSTGAPAQDVKESRSVSNIFRLLMEAEHIGFDCPEIGQLQERSAAIKAYQEQASQALANKNAISIDTCTELLEEGRSFNVDIPEVDRLSRVLEQIQWDERAASSRKVLMSLQEVHDLISEGERLEVPAYNDHLQYWREQLRAGQAWESKALELISAEFIHFPQLEAFAAQVQANALPVSAETLRAIDRILSKQREAHRQALDTLERSKRENPAERPKYSEVIEMIKEFEELAAKPNGTIEIENERKRHEDWMRKGKKLFGKSNAPLHILKSHLEYVLERNKDCFDLYYDTPRNPGEPVSREASPDGGPSRSRQVFCICRRPEAGMMIECELCHEWYHYKCLKIARGKVKEDDKYTCPICDWRMKIPRDASRPKLEDLHALVDEIAGLPFQPEEEEILRQIIDNAQHFRDHIARHCNPMLSTEAEVEIQRFYLRKIEGAEVLLSYETNLFRQELHKWCPVAPEAPPILEVSLSTRKPRPTKLQKMLAEYGVDNPDDLPEHAKGKANSLRRKAANAEAAAAAAASQSGGSAPTGQGQHPPGGSGFFPHTSHPSVSGIPAPSNPSTSQAETSIFHPGDPMDIDGGVHPALLGAGGPHLHVADTPKSLEERLLQGEVDDVELQTEEGKSKALEILSRTDEGRREAERIWGSDVWGTPHRSISDQGRSMTPGDIDPMMKHDDGNVDQMFKEMTNQDDDDDQQKKRDTVADSHNVTAESLEKERNGLDAMLDMD